MTENSTTNQPVDGEPRRWSEPVQIGEIIAALRSAIERRGRKTARESHAQTVARGRLRQAG